MVYTIEEEPQCPGDDDVEGRNTEQREDRQPEAAKASMMSPTVRDASPSVITRSRTRNVARPASTTIRRSPRPAISPDLCIDAVPVVMVLMLKTPN